MRNLLFLSYKSDTTVIIPVSEDIEFYAFHEGDSIVVRIQSSRNLNGITLRTNPVTYLGANTTEALRNMFFNEVYNKVKSLIQSTLIEYFQDEVPDAFIETDLLLKKINDLVAECQKNWALKHCFNK